MSPSNYSGKRTRTPNNKNKLNKTSDGSLLLQKSPPTTHAESSSRPSFEISPALAFISSDQNKKGGNVDVGILRTTNTTNEKSRLRHPSSSPSMPRINLKPKASFRNKSSKPFTPVRSNSSHIALDRKLKDVDMGIESPPRRSCPVEHIDQMVLSMPSAANDTPGAPNFSPTRQAFSSEIAFLRPPSQDSNVQDQSLLISSPPKRSTRITNIPATCQRRKKPSGYQQAGRDDAEEAEDSNGDRCYYNSKNNPFAQRERSFSDVLDRDPKNLNFGLASKRPSADDIIFTSPVKGGRNHYTPYVATPKKPTIAGASKNTYPFSPNPFSPHFSPIPQSQQNDSTGNTSFSPIKQGPLLPFVRATPKKQYRALPKTPRGRRGQPMLDLGVPSNSFDSNSINSINCNMSVSTSVTNDIDFTQQSRHLLGTKNTGRHFTGSPIIEHDHQNKANKSFDSTLASPTPSESTVNMSFDMSSTDNNLIENRHPLNVKIDLDMSSDKPNRPQHHKDVSPVEVQSFPPPNTPCKQRPTYSLTPRREKTLRPKNKHRHTTSSGKEDMYNFLHTNNMQIDTQVDASSTNYINSPSSSSTPTSVYPQQQFTSSRFATDFEEVGQLGSGSFGTVYKCMSRLDGCIYAIKIAKRKAKGKTDLERMKTEVYAMAAICDKPDTGTFHIVRYHQAWLEDDRLYMQTELCDSTLAEEMKNTKLFRNAARKYKLLREMLLALSLIHRENMVHLDIKPENIFIKGDQYKLGDFGLVAKATTEGHVEEGDSRYMSLELLDGDHLDLTKVRNLCRAFHDSVLKHLSKLTCHLLSVL